VKERKMIYGHIVENKARSAFESVNRHDYDSFNALCVANVIHRFSGDHALGGVRHIFYIGDC